MKSENVRKLVEGIDYYMEGDKLVFTAHYHLARGYCCNSKCRHCPYGPGSPHAPVQILGITGLDLPVKR